jgi:hypothetical protein
LDIAKKLPNEEQKENFEQNSSRDRGQKLQPPLISKIARKAKRFRNLRPRTKGFHANQNEI